MFGAFCGGLAVGVVGTGVVLYFFWPKIQKTENIIVAQFAALHAKIDAVAKALNIKL